MLSITSTSPEQAKIINSNPYKDNTDNMIDEDGENEIVIAGVDTSNSIIRQHETQVTDLQLENSILKSNLSDNFDRLNNALSAVAQMQRMLAHHDMLPKDRLIPIIELVKPATPSPYNDEKYDDPLPPKQL